MGLGPAAMFWRLFVTLAAIALVPGLGGAPAAAEFKPCDGLPAEIAAEIPDDHRLACQGAGDAIAFFLSADLKVETPVRVRIVQRFPPHVTESAAGCFIERDGVALLRPYARFRGGETWFQVPVEPELYRSLAAHEVAHALATYNFSIAHPNIRAKEYVAYVVMFEVMNPDLRSRILRGYPALGITSAQRLTELLCLVDPMRFGIESYRYHTRPEVGLRFLRRVLDGAELND